MKMQDIDYQLRESNKSKNLPKELGFGKIFTDHIFEMEYNQQNGWHNPKIKPADDFLIHPAAMFIHYGQAVFEGLKAYKTVKNEIVVFRAADHFKRLNRSSARLCIPQVDVDFMVHALKELIVVEKNWIPAGKGESLYIRPFIFGSDSFLGVKSSVTFKLILLLSPVGAYYKEGFKPVKILVQDDYVRAVRKGIGEAKTPANYAASLLAAEEAQKKGYSQVLWLDGIEQKYIEEVGTMNIFVRFKDEIITPKLNGSILPGMTRDSVLEILKDWGTPASERLVSVDEVIEKYKEGNLLGVFGTGTAAVISSVGWMTYKDMDMTINNGQPDELAIKLFDEITSIQLGRKPDKFKWITHIEKEKVAVN